MLQPRLAAPMKRAFISTSSVCFHCESRFTGRAFAQQLPVRTFTSARKLRQPDPAPQAAEPTPDPKDEGVFIPKPLGRPIGFKHPPQAGENAGNVKVKKDYSGMTMSQRNLERRKDLVEKWGTNYFRDFKNIRKYRSGKTFMANPRIFKSDAALYFPNFHGENLQEKETDTTPVLEGRISVVNVYSSHWGEIQAQTFTGKKANPELHEILATSGVAQMVDINIEENSMKAWIIALFKWRLQAARPKEDWAKYFIIRSGVSPQIRETIGLLNGRVGYVFIVDEQCRIRWAGSGDAEGTEMQDMNRGFKKLVNEAY